MATRADLRRIIEAHRDVRTLAVADARRLWDSLDHDDPLEVREALEDLLPPLVDGYGEIAATVTADWYDDLRDAAGVSGAFSAVLAAPVAAEAVRANARWAIGPLFSADPDPEAAFGLLAGEVDRLTLQSGRQTVSASVKNDPAGPRWARVPQGRTCAFCLTLASRGAVYRSEETAGGLHPDSYHADCDCVPTPVWPDQPYPEGYDPDALYEQYREAVETAPARDAKTVLSTLRQLQGIH